MKRWFFAWFLMYLAVGEVAIAFYQLASQGFPWTQFSFMYLIGTCATAAMFITLSLRLVVKNMQVLVIHEN